MVSTPSAAMTARAAARRPAAAWRWLRWLALWLAGTLGPQAAQALCLAPLCTCSASTTSVVFLPYNPLTLSASDSTGNVRVHCGGVLGLLIPYEIGLSKGGGTSIAARQLSKASKRLSYNLYTDGARSAIWGDGSGGSLPLSSGLLLDALGLAPARDHPVYGRITGGQFSVEPGSYSDSLTVTLTYY